MKKRTWVISDTHFFHTKLSDEFGQRPQGFTETTIKALQRMLEPQDTLIHLGDLILAEHDKLKGIMDSIAGRKILVRGNHDRKSASWYEDRGFHFACDCFALGSLVFTHRPLHPDKFPHGVRINVHGHLHNKMHREPPAWLDPGGIHRLFCLEHGYTPILLPRFLQMTDRNNKQA